MVSAGLLHYNYPSLVYEYLFPNLLEPNFSKALALGTNSPSPDHERQAVPIPDLALPECAHTVP